MGTSPFFTNHLNVLALLAERPDVRVRQIAREIGITERATHRIIGELAANGYLTRGRTGARNRYEIHQGAVIASPLPTEMTIGRLLGLLRGDDGSDSGAASPRPAGQGRHAELLAESEDRFRCLFDHAPIGLALVATDGRFLKINRALCELLGYPETALLRTNFQTVTHPDDLDNDLHHAAELLAGRRASYQIHKRYRHAEGQTVHTRLSASVVRGVTNQPLYFVSQIEASNLVQLPAVDPVQAPRRLQTGHPRSITGP